MLNKFNKVIAICFPKISKPSKLALWEVLNKGIVSEQASLHGISESSIYKNRSKFIKMYNMICKAEELFK